jgi:3' terminal RNA ribose 2'-O-methyltransferase Hen1
MLLTITNTDPPATDLGYLLHKNPSRVQTYELSFGLAHVFYPIANLDCCSVALALDIDPISLIRGRQSGEGKLLEHYVNDRPYAASSFLSVAIAQVFGSALSGRCKQRPEMVEAELSLQAGIAALPCRGGEGFLRRLFEPLGYKVELSRHVLDEKFPDWGESVYFSINLQAHCRLKDLLAHLYVLIPVMDDEKHYWVGDEEVEKLLRHGTSWLASHPEKEIIARRYLKHRISLVHAALARLSDESGSDPDEGVEIHATEEALIEKRISLNEQRLNAVIAALRKSGAKRIIDLGCGEGRLLKLLLEERSFEDIVGLDVSHRILERAVERLHIDRLPEKQKSRIRLIQGSLTYRDGRLGGYDAATVVEVVEHLDGSRLAAFERVLFEYARPSRVILTTPNIEYNVKFENLPAGGLRNRDHRFEWTRNEFQTWACSVAERFGYSVCFFPVGPEDPLVGAPTQMSIFTEEGETTKTQRHKEEN